MFYGGSADSPQIREWLPPEKVGKQKFPCRRAAKLHN